MPRQNVNFVHRDEAFGTHEIEGFVCCVECLTLHTALPDILFAENYGKSHANCLKTATGYLYTVWKEQPGPITAWIYNRRLSEDIIAD